MNHVFIYVGAGITAVIILIAGFFIQKEFRLRQKQTNLRLPDIDELEREARLAKMKESSEEYGFAKLDKINERELKFASEDDNAEKYVASTDSETSIFDDFTGLMNEDGKLQPSVPRLIKSNIELPNLGTEKEN